MLVTNHVLAGAVIGALSRTKRGAFLAGTASHFALDSIPHWGTTSRSTFLRTAVADGLLGATAMATITALTPREHRGRIVAGMTGAALPDMNKPSNLFFGSSPFPDWVDRFHGSIQDESPNRLDQELLVGGLLTATLAGLRHRAQTRPRTSDRRRSGRL